MGCRQKDINGYIAFQNKFSSIKWKECKNKGRRKEYHNAFPKISIKVVPVKNEIEYTHILSRLFLLWDSQCKLLFLSSLTIFTNHLCLKNYWKSSLFENTTTIWPVWEIRIASTTEKVNPQNQLEFSYHISLLMSHPSHPYSLFKVFHRLFLPLELFIIQFWMTHVFLQCSVSKEHPENFFCISNKFLINVCKAISAAFLQILDC